ncbi:YdcF family protein [Aneurinibacillus danicus]|nr:YdcF family protein [Aneurinibacillus danicus]
MQLTQQPMQTDIKRNRRRRRAVSLLWTILLLPVLYISGVHMAIMNAAKQQPAQDADYMIILGAALWGEEMSPSLRYRMDTALSYLKQNPRTKVIVSGGQGVGEDMPEAVAMQRFLLENGVPQERIIVEDRAQTTSENILFSKKLMKSNQAVLVTNDFHILRAKLLAERAGIEAQTLSAPTPESVKVKLFVREYAALLKSWLFD